MPADTQMVSTSTDEQSSDIAQHFAAATTALDDLAEIRDKEVSEVSDQVSKVAGAATDAGRAVVKRLEQKQAEKKTRGRNDCASQRAGAGHSKARSRNERQHWLPTRENWRPASQPRRQKRR